MSNQKKNFVLFDFDGVIADSFLPTLEVTQKICPHITDEAYRKRFDGNINDWEEPMHTEDCRNDINFFGEYIPRMENEVTPIVGMEGVIKKLSQTYALIIVSSTITAPIQKFIEKYHLAAYFTEVMGNDIHASKVEKIKMIFSKYGINNDRCLFITDTLGDMKEALHMNVASIGVVWGFQNRETLSKGNPFRIVEKPEELFPTITDYFRNTQG